MDAQQHRIVRELPAGLLLANGGHKSADDGMCLMEAVAYVAGEPHSDSPACASPILASIGRRAVETEVDLLQLLKEKV